MSLFGVNGQTLVQLDGGNFKEVPADDMLANKKIVAYYFSAHWCPPCRAFTPMLKDAYEDYLSEASDADIEIVFVSSDRSLDDMKNYMKESHGSWLAISHNSELAQSLKTKFGIQGIPALVVCKSDGSVLTKEGRADIQKSGPEGIKGWVQKA